MKQSHLTSLGFILLLFLSIFSTLNAEDDITIDTDDRPQLHFDDTDDSGNLDWTITGDDDYFQIYDHRNDIDSLRVNSDGDIRLADSTLFLDKSSHYVGIFNSSPEVELHVGKTGNIMLEWPKTSEKPASKWLIGTDEDGGIAFADADNNISAKIFKMEAKAPKDSLYIDANGSIGIGTNDPKEILDTLSIDAASRFQLTSITDTANESAQFIQRRARSNSGKAEAIESGDSLGFYSFRGYTGSSWTGSKAALYAMATEDWDGSSNGNKLVLAHTPNGSTKLKTALEIKGNADVYIPNGNLYVGSTEMNVPDYVFEENYKLMSLTQLKHFIQTNKHLPGITSAKEVGKVGAINLSDLQMRLLEKVEELTLYTLQQEEELAKQRATIKSLSYLQERLERVEAQLKSLSQKTQKQ